MFRPHRRRKHCVTREQLDAVIHAEHLLAARVTILEAAVEQLQEEVAALELLIS